MWIGLVCVMFSTVCFLPLRASHTDTEQCYVANYCHATAAQQLCLSANTQSCFHCLFQYLWDTNSKKTILQRVKMKKITVSTNVTTIQCFSSNMLLMEVFNLPLFRSFFILKIWHCNRGWINLTFSLITKLRYWLIHRIEQCHSSFFSLSLPKSIPLYVELTMEIIILYVR